MEFRIATEKEKMRIYKIEHEFWGTGIHFNDYVKDSEQEEKNGGLRFILVNQDEIYGCLIATTLNNVPKLNIPMYGISSVIVPCKERRKGYGIKMMKDCIAYHHLENPKNVAMLYSDINPSFYEKIGFKALPSKYQINEHSTCMIHCDAYTYDEIVPYVTKLGFDY